MTARLKSVLDEALPDMTSLGGDSRYVDRDKLVHLLGGLSSELSRAYWLRMVISAAVMAVLLVAIWRFSDTPLLLAGAAGAIGLALIGALATLQGVSEDMARVRLLLSVAPDLSLEALTEIARCISSGL